MSVETSNGIIYAIASAYDASVAMSAVTNASPAVATLANGHGITEGDILELTSGWGKLNGRIVRAGTVSVDDVELEGIDTSNASLFAAGSGVGSVRKITDWTEIAQVTEVARSGGEQNFAQYQFLADEDQKQLPTFRSAKSMTFTIADDPSLPCYAVMESVTLTKQDVAVRATLPGGGAIYYNGIMSFDDDPSVANNEIKNVQSSYSLQSKPQRYAA